MSNDTSIILVVILQLIWDGTQNELLWLILHTASATVFLFVFYLLCFFKLMPPKHFKFANLHTLDLRELVLQPRGLGGSSSSSLQA